MHGIVDEKTDIFAFGVLLLEIVTGRRPIDCSKQSLLQWVSTRERNDTNMMFTSQQFAHMTYSCCLGKATAGSWASDSTCRPKPRRRLWQRSTEQDGRSRISLHYATGDVAAFNGRGANQFYYYLSCSGLHIVKCLLMTVCHCPLLRMSFFRFCITCLLLMSVWRNPRNGTFPRTRWTTWMIVHCFLNLVHRNCSLLFSISFCMCCWHAFLVMVMELCFLVCSLRWLVFNHVIYDGDFWDVFSAGSALSVELEYGWGWGWA